LDYGERRIGVAMSDLFGWTAQGLEVIDRKVVDDPLARIAELVKLHEVESVVVGLPKNMNGTVGPSGENCIAFAETLRQTLNLPVRMWDERLTTVSAERTLRGSGREPSQAQTSDRQDGRGDSAARLSGFDTEMRESP